MKTRVERRGRTIDEAIEEAMKELGVASRDDVEVEVVEGGSRGLFGLLGGREALVRVQVRKRGKAEYARQLLRDIFAAMRIDAAVEVTTRNDEIRADINGRGLGVLIGRRGQTLDALQYLVNLAASRVSAERQRVILDVSGYRQRREETLARLARRLAERVRRTGQQVTLEPMTAQQRRIIHLALQGHPEVYTRSEGEEPYRKVVISVRD